MFLTLRSEVRDRFKVLEKHFKHSPVTPPDVSKTSKGLVFVEIYAVYEYTVRQATQTAIQVIASHNHPFNKLRPSLAAVFLHPQLEALRMCKNDNVWRKRLELMNKADSIDTIAAVNVVPHDGSHFRYSQVQIIFETLGINLPFVRHPRQAWLIDEVVRHRNAIAHGEESPQQIGANFTSADVLSRIQDMREVCLKIITLMSKHCSVPRRHRR